MTAAIKKAFALDALARTALQVDLDPRRSGVRVPAHLRDTMRITLSFAREGCRIAPTPELTVDDEGLRATLAFDEGPFACVIPWGAVFVLAADTGERRVFFEDMPAGLPLGHLDACSFCGVERVRVARLVAGDGVSICDVCVAKHRPRRVADIVRGCLSRRRSAAVEARGATPYRDGPAVVCSFCRAPSTAWVTGPSVRICRPCLTLAADVIAEVSREG